MTRLNFTDTRSIVEVLAQNFGDNAHIQVFTYRRSTIYEGRMNTNNARKAALHAINRGGRTAYQRSRNLQPRFSVAKFIRDIVGWVANGVGGTIQASLEPYQCRILSTILVASVTLVCVKIVWEIAHWKYLPEEYSARPAAHYSSSEDDTDHCSCTACLRRLHRQILENEYGSQAKPEKM